MRDVATKADGVDSLAAGDFNATQNETENVVTSADISLDPAGGADTNLNMMSQAIAGYAGGSWAYTESGAADAHVVSIASNLKPPTKYFDNLIVAYIPGNVNTSTTVTVNVSSLGAKNIRIVGGGLPPVGSIKNDRGLILKYNDSAGYFEIMKGVIDDHDHSAADSEGGDLGSIQADEITIVDSPAGTPDVDTLYKENIVKGWIEFDGTGGIAILDSFNVSSIVDVGPGDYTINWDRDFSSINYAVAPGSDGAGFTAVYTSKAVGSLKISVYNSTPVLVDTSLISCIACGVQ